MILIRNILSALFASSLCAQAAHAQDPETETDQPIAISSHIGAFIEIRLPQERPPENTPPKPETPPEQADTRDFIDRLTKEQEKNITDRAFPLNTAIWDFAEIFVCWQDMDAAFADQRAMVQAAVNGTWEAASALEFFGWAECVDGAGGIHIAIRDEAPHVKLLGQFIDGMSDGMVLNFIYDTWSPMCQDQIEYCTTIIAIHEFGHAIGFAHEQNRPDTPEDCDQAQGSDGDNTSITDWDPSSVMNYCNAIYGNDGVLSDLDVAAVQYIYGKD